MVLRTIVKIFFFLSSRKFEARIYVVKISAARDQNQLLNPPLKLESLSIPAPKPGCPTFCPSRAKLFPANLSRAKNSLLFKLMTFL